MTHYKLLSLAIVVLAMPMQALAVSPEEFIHAATWEDNETVRRALEENIDPDRADALRAFGPGIRVGAEAR